MAKNTAPALPLDSRSRMHLSDVAHSAEHIQELAQTIKGILDLVKSGSELGYDNAEAAHEFLEHGYYLAVEALDCVDSAALTVRRSAEELGLRPENADMPAGGAR